MRELSARLASEGWIDPWVDEKKLLPGQDWRAKIEEAVETSDIVIICLSSNSVTKEGFVQKELRYAREIAFEKPDETIFLIPLRLDDCAVPRGLRFYQWADYFGEQADESYSALLESLKLRHEQKLKLETEEHARWEKAEKERIASEEKARKEAEEKAHWEVEERARWEAEERERKAAEAKARKEAEEKTRQETEDRARIEKAEKDRKAAEVAAQKKAQRDSATIARRENAKQRAIQLAALKDNISKLFAFSKSKPVKALPRLRIVGYLSIAIALVWIVLWGYSKLPLANPIAAPRATLTLTLPTKTLTLTPTLTLSRTPTFTPTITHTPTLTPTATTIPRGNILLQRNFENGDLGLWSQKGGRWVIEKDPDGNHYLSGSSSSMQPRISYSYQDPRWTDYALETRVKFIKGYSLSIQVREGCLDHPCYYEVAVREYGIDFYGSNWDWVKIAGPISRTFDLNRWYMIRVEIKDDLLSLYIDNTFVQEEKVPESINSRGGFPYGGIVFILDIGSEVYFDDIRVWSLN